MCMRSFHLFLQKRNRNLQKNNQTNKTIRFSSCFPSCFWRRCWLQRNVPSTSLFVGWCVCAACRSWTECSISWPGRVSSTPVCWQQNSLCSQKHTALWASSSTQDYYTSVMSCEVFIVFATTYFLMFFSTLYILWFYAEKCYHHWCRGFRTGCCTPAAKLWHSGKDPHLAWSLVPSPLIVIK